MNNLKDKIKTAYSEIVSDNAPAACCGPTSAGGGCCSPSTEPMGFSEDYTRLPGYDPNADYGLGCGIPVAFAGIEAGHTVLDLGSGAGNDVFVARALAGDKGRVIGVDMTPAMIEKANSNKQRLGYKNVEFILGDIENLPLPENHIDVVISNCVLNLVPDKLKAYRGIYHVLKPNGHFSISDVVVSGELPDTMKNIVELYSGCIGGAMVKEDYIEAIRQAGFKNVEVMKEKTVDLPDSFLNQYLSREELTAFRNTGIRVLSITVNGNK